MLSVDNLSLTLSGNEILKDVSFKVNKGEIAVILGNSGSGKTSLLKCLAGIYPIDKGTIKYKDSDLELDVKDDNWAPSVTMLFQGHGLFPNLTALENLEIIKSKSRLTDEGFERELVELTEELDVAEHLKKLPYQLSHGQCQRISIIRSLLLSPYTLLLDEPSSSIDDALTYKLGEIIKSRNSEMLVIFASHDTYLSQNIGDLFIKIESQKYVNTFTSFYEAISLR